MAHATSSSNHKSEVYATNASFVYSAKYTHAVLSLSDPQPGERIIDSGCGTGDLTSKIKDAVGDQGEVVGVDSSESMSSKAESASGGKITYLQADIQDLPKVLDAKYKGAFDAVFTSAVLHWTKRDPRGVVEGISWLLKPGGRFVFEFGGFGNTVGIRSGIHQVLRNKGVDPEPLDPWYFPTAAQYTKLLKDTGLNPSEDIASYPRPTPLPGDLKGWLQTFVRNTFFAAFTSEEQETMMGQVQDICRVDNHWADEDGKEGWEIMYVRSRGSATKPQ